MAKKMQSDTKCYMTILPEVLGESLGTIQHAGERLYYREFIENDITLYLRQLLTLAQETLSDVTPEAVILSTETTAITPETTSSIRCAISEVFSKDTDVIGINLGNSSNLSLSLTCATDKISQNSSSAVLCVLIDMFRHHSSRLLAGGLAALSDGGCSFYISGEPLRSQSYRIESSFSVSHPACMTSASHDSIKHFQYMTEKVKNSLTNGMYSNVVLNNYSKKYNEYFAKKLDLDIESLIYSEDYGHVSSSDGIINVRRIAELVDYITLIVNSRNMTGVIQLQQT